MFKESLKVNLNFRGNRNYIYAADIAEAMFNTVGFCKNIRMEFHHTASSAIQICEISAAELINFKKRDDLYALMVCKDIFDIDRYMVAVSDSNAQSPSQIPYDESVHTLCASIHERSVDSSVNSLQKTPLLAIVALNKVLLNHFVDINQWFFVKLELQQWPLDIKKINLYISTISNHNLYKSNIFNSDKLIGNIYFYRRNE